MGTDAIDRRGRRREWADLADGPAGLIAERLLAADVADYVRFRAVCRPWRRCCDDPRAHSALDRRFHPRRWHLLRQGFADPCRRRLLNLSTGQFVHAHLPELQGSSVYGPTSEGLLVLLHQSTYALRLLNPLTRQVAELPPSTTIFAQLKDHLHEVVQVKDVEVDGAGLVDDCSVAILCVEVGVLAVAKPGDESWTLLNLGDHYLFPTMSFGGRFYGVDDLAIMLLETRENKPPRLVKAAEMTLLGWSFFREAETMHLVDNDGELMLVRRTTCSISTLGDNDELSEEDSDDDCSDRVYQVYRVDLDAGKKIIHVNSLDGRALFITRGKAVSVSPTVFPSICADTVYAGFEYGDKISAYHIVDERTELSNLHLRSELGCPWTLADYLSVNL